MLQSADTGVSAVQYYYKKIDDNGVTKTLFTYDYIKPQITNPLIIEITNEEYNSALAEIEAANQPDESDTDEISDEEALNIILGVSE